jgi:GNAT superfamily N-acetyltransferase
LIRVDHSCCDVVANMLGDTPFTVTPCFFLRRRECNVYVDDAAQPQAIVVVTHITFADVYVFVRAPLGTAGVESLADFISRLEFQGGLFVPAELVQPIRARRRIFLEAEGLCFTYLQVPRDFTVTRPELVRRLSPADTKAVDQLPSAASFLYRNYFSPEALLTEGIAFGVLCKGCLVSLAALLALTSNYCDVGVYTLPRYRNRGYATDCVEALFAEIFVRGARPLWRIGIQQKLAIYFAEKLGMKEIGTTGGEVYLQVYPVR